MDNKVFLVTYKNISSGHYLAVFFVSLVKFIISNFVVNYIFIAILATIRLKQM